MIDVTPLGSATGALERVEIDCNALGFRALLKHLRRLPGCRVGFRFAWPITDDFWATFHYQGFAFRIESPFADYWIEKATECPAEVFEAVIAHLRAYEPSTFRRWMIERSRTEKERWQKRLERAVEEGAHRRQA